MTPPRLSLAFLGLSLSSSWGNGHATTYRALIKGLAARGHDVLFLERDVPWYADNRDLAKPSYCRLAFYNDLVDLERRFSRDIAAADAVVVGSFVPDGVAVSRLALSHARGLVGFYDIDTPVTLRRLEAGDEEYLSADLVPQFDFYLSFTSGPTLRRLRDEFGARRATAFHCMVDPALYRRTGDAVMWDLGYLGTYSADRQPALEQLLLEPARRLPDRRFVVAGAQYPDVSDWPANVEWIEHVAPRDHAAFYSRLRFALNLTRADMRAAGWSPSVRLFEAASCGTAILSDRWAGLTELFPENEAIRVVDATADVVALLSGADEREIARMADRARQIVLAEHTGDQRALELETILVQAGVTAQGRRDSDGRHDAVAIHA